MKRRIGATLTGLAISAILILSLTPSGEIKAANIIGVATSEIIAADIKADIGDRAPGECIGEAIAETVNEKEIDGVNINTNINIENKAIGEDNINIAAIGGGATDDINAGIVA